MRLARNVFLFRIKVLRALIVGRYDQNRRRDSKLPNNIKKKKIIFKPQPTCLYMYYIIHLERIFSVYLIQKQHILIANQTIQRIHLEFEWIRSKATVEFCRPGSGPEDPRADPLLSLLPRLHPNGHFVQKYGTFERK